MVETLQKLTFSREEALRTLVLLAEALHVSGLDVDDERLHLGFFSSRKRIHVTVVQRYVAWLDHNSAFGFMLDDASLAKQLEEELKPHAWVGWFRRPDTPTIHVQIKPT